jgi:hypothetical protein
MMDHVATLKMAIDLMHFPLQVRLMRSAPLPDGVLTLVRVAAGDEEATSQATEAVGSSRDTVREAAAFFIEQILLHPDADSYRVLGARPEASNAELRRNMSLLLRWLHPDHDQAGGRSVFARRVTRAWNDLKTQERRAAYDQQRRISLAEKSRLRKKGRAGAQLRKQASNHRLHNSAHYHRHVTGSFNNNLGPTGLLRRFLLLLLGRAVH